MTTPFPFSAVVGAEDAKLALMLTATDARIGGVLLRGDKGSAKSTLARGIAALLPGGAPFVELPVGASEERLIGSLDVAAALGEGAVRFEAGLLAAAHGGVLYVDEINLLPDHLVDALLDAAASGINRVERDGFSHEHAARFVLVGSMNPEEGELRPQLLDRMGLAVDVRASADPDERALAVRRRLDFDADPEGFVARWRSDEHALAQRLADAAPAYLPEHRITDVAALCAAMGVEGLRGDLVICRAAAALAGLEGERAVSADHIRRVAPLALAHRARRHPFDPPGVDADELDQHLDDHVGGGPAPPPPGDDDAAPGDTSHDSAGTGAPSTRRPDADRPDVAMPDPADARSVLDLTTARTARADQSARRGPPGTPSAAAGRVVGDRAAGPRPSSVAVAPTVRTAARRRAASDGEAPVLVAADLREPVREAPTGMLVVVAVDASASMGAADRLAAVHGAVLGLLTDVYQRRDRVALVTFQGDDASVVLRPTGSIEVARARLGELRASGPTPLAAGLRTALDVARGAPDGNALLVVVTDGRATAAADGVAPVAAAHAAAAEVRRAGVEAIVIDAESGPVRLGLAGELADALGARHVRLDELTAVAVERTIREAIRPA